MKLFDKLRDRLETARARIEVAKAKREVFAKQKQILLEETKSTQNSKTETSKKLHHVTKSRAIISKFDKKKVIKKRRFSKFLEDFLEKAGIDKKPVQISSLVLQMTVFLTVLLELGFVFYAVTNLLSPMAYLVFMPLILIFGFGLIYLLILIVLFVYFDFKIHQRTGQIEDVLPDFLQLASANISAGMPIDRALWFAVRPRFGVLAKEMEEIAKATFTGSELDEALLRFTKKYNSRLLKESVNLIIAGLKSGGELGSLLNNISENIQQTKIMRKEISASVMTYVIFIGVASVLAAPLLFALSSQLLGVVTGLASNFDASAMEDLPSGATPISFTFGGEESLKASDFRIFAFVLMFITSFFAAAIIGVIQNGDSKSGLTKFPMFFVVSIIIFYFSNKLLGTLLGGIMG